MKSMKILALLVLTMMMATMFAGAAVAETQSEPELPEIEIYIVNVGRIYYGDDVTLSARQGAALEGISLQWQCSADGVNWLNVSGSNGVSHTFEINDSTVKLAWRLVASI